MKYIWWVGLVPSLLIGGLIVAPVHSEASGTLIQIQSGPNSVGGAAVVYNALVPIPITASTCPSTTYTRCFALTPGTYANVAVANVSGSIAKLLIGDFTGAGSKLDVITLSGVKFTSPDRTVKVIFTHKLDDSPNSGGGSYSYGARIGGYFQAGDGTSYNDFVKLSGSGGFFSIPQLNFTVGGAASASNPFSLQNVSPYSSGTCPIPCTPTITQTMTFVLIGADSLNLTNSVDGGGSDCNLGTAGVLGPGANPARPCHGGANSLANKISSFLNDAAQADAAAFSLLAGAAPINESCIEGCTQDPDIINPGKITIYKHIDDACVTYSSCTVRTFTFHIDGPQTTTASVNTDANGEGFSEVWLSPGTYSVFEDAQRYWEIRNNLSTACGGGPTTGVEVTSAGNVNCDFTNRSHFPD